MGKILIGCSNSASVAKSWSLWGILCFVTRVGKIRIHLCAQDRDAAYEVLDGVCLILIEISLLVVRAVIVDKRLTHDH